MGEGIGDILLEKMKHRGFLVSNFIAHQNQTLCDHLEGVAKLAKSNAEKIGMGKYGELLGLLHDFGKYSAKFQKYIADALKKNDPDFNPDEDEGYEDPAGRRGRIDHSTAGAQYLSIKTGTTNAHKILAQILSLCLVSHHSGLIDCLSTDNNGTWDSYSKRVSKDQKRTHLQECIKNIDLSIREKIDRILADQSFTAAFEDRCRDIIRSSPEKKPESAVAQFQIGLLARFLFSTLIDADRQDTADTPKPKTARYRQGGRYRSWDVLIDRLEKKYGTFEIRNSVDEIRKTIADRCLQEAQRPNGLYTLTVPTGGGKTLASLRFALHHAKYNEKKHGIDRIIYVIPFTSIIDQNAQVVREILEPEYCLEDSGRIVLEHHSNIGADTQSWKEKLLAENWDAPVVFITMVQFLEALFGAGTRGARRVHQLGKAVIVFDEIQTLPIQCVHLFNNAINFLVNHCGSSVVLSTATQPLLGSVEEKKGSLILSEGNELMQNVNELYTSLKRVHVQDCRKSPGWSYSEIADLALNQVVSDGSCLVVVNTKKAARTIFETAKSRGIEVFHLSAGMCPAHRKVVIESIRQKLDDEEPILCVSTQVIEAGVDVDFHSVVRVLAGLDSIAQAAGRCNRHGRRESGKVLIVNAVDEALDYLKEIAVGQEKANRVLDDFRENPLKYDGDVIGPKLLEWYYQNYFYARKAVMDYPVQAGRNDTILNQLACNTYAEHDFGRVHGQKPGIFLRQSFMTAAKMFKSIDAPTRSVIVQYEKEGKELVNQLCSAFEVKKQFALIKKAQQYSVNLFPYEFDKLQKKEPRALNLVQKGTEIFYIDDRYYSKEFGISMEPINQEDFFYA